MLWDGPGLSWGSTYPQFSQREGQALWGWRLLLWLPVLLGSASGHLAICLLDSELYLREDSTRAESLNETISLPNSKLQVAPA